MIVFRCDANAHVGMGHLVRCRTLAGAFQRCGEPSIMLGPGFEYCHESDRKIFLDWEPQLEWQSSDFDAEYIARRTHAVGARVAIIDDYRVDEAYQLHLKRSGVHWLQFEGAAMGPIWADYLLNANPGALLEHYRQYRCNPTSRLLLGAKYAILRSEFPVPTDRSAGGPIRKIFISFGGGDDRGVIRRVLDALLCVVPGDVDFLVVSGKTNPGIEALRLWLHKKECRDRVDLRVEPESMAHCMAECDIAVISGGGITYEAASCGLPMIILALADNQRRSLAWSECGAGIYLGHIDEIDFGNIGVAVQQLLATPVLRQQMSKAGRHLVDGRGADRVVAILMGRSDE